MANPKYAKWAKEEQERQRAERAALKEELAEQGKTLAGHKPRTFAEAVFLGRTQEFEPVPEPTDVLTTPPGSRERVEQMAARVARGEPVFGSADTNGSKGGESGLASGRDIALMHDYREPRY